MHVHACRYQWPPQPRITRIFLNRYSKLINSCPHSPASSANLHLCEKDHNLRRPCPNNKGNIRRSMCSKPPSQCTSAQFRVRLWSRSILSSRLQDELLHSLHLGLQLCMVEVRLRRLRRQISTKDLPLRILHRSRR